MYPGIRYPNNQVGSLVCANDDGAVRSIVYAPLVHPYSPCRFLMHGCEAIYVLVASARVAVAKPVMVQQLHNTGKRGFSLLRVFTRPIATYLTAAFAITSKHMLSFLPVANDSIVLKIHPVVPVFPNRKSRIDRVHSRSRGRDGVMMR